MAKDFIVDLEDRPGSGATAAEALGKAGINIAGFCALAFGGKAFAHVLVEDATATRSAIEQAGFRSSMSAMPWSPRLRTDLVSWVSCCGGSPRPTSI